MVSFHMLYQIGDKSQSTKIRQEFEIATTSNGSVTLTIPLFLILHDLMIAQLDTTGVMVSTQVGKVATLLFNSLIGGVINSSYKS